MLGVAFYRHFKLLTKFDMKTTSLKTIYLTEDELKQAIVEYLAKENKALAKHLRDNHCEMAWSLNEKGHEFRVSIDGEVEDCRKSYINAAIDEAVGDYEEAFGILAESSLGEKISYEDQ